MTSILAVDIGNTDVKFGLFVGGSLVQLWRLEAWRKVSSLQLPEALKQSLNIAQVPYKALVYSSVAPELDGVLGNCVVGSGLLSEEHFLNANPSRSPSKNSFSFPVDFSRYAEGQLGTDRLITTCAAALRYPKQPLLVMNFGTATTFDLIDAQGVYQGGAITPGWRIFSQVLHEKTAKLPLVDFNDKAYTGIEIGLNTVSCIEAGLGIGYRGLLLSLMDKFKETVGSNPYKLVTTGGSALEVSKVCGLEIIETQYHSTLLLEGLVGIYNGF